MYRNFARKALLILATASILSGCGKKSEPVKTTEEAPVKESVFVKKPTISYATATVIYDEMALWTENADGDMVWLMTLSRGTPFQTIKEDGEFVTKEADRIISKKKEKRKFIKALYEDKECWAQENMTANDSKPGVILEENTWLYNNPDMLETPKVKVGSGLLVAVHNNGEENGFEKISLLDEKGTLRKDVYVKKNSVSIAKNEVATIVLKSKFDGIEDEIVKQEVLEVLNLLGEK